MADALQFEVVGPVDGDTDLEMGGPEIQQYLVKNVTQIGPYSHGNRFTAYIWENQERSMEYDGAVTSNVAALEHEVFHSWYARGIKPASQNDGWIDEAWDNYNTTADAL